MSDHNDETEEYSDEVLREKEEATMEGTTARIIVEVENDGGLTELQRKELAIALLEEGANTDAASWDHHHSVATRGNRTL